MNSNFDEQQIPLFEEPDRPVKGKARERPSRIGRASIDYMPARDILTRATGFMGSYDYTLNPYAGCSFACTYCYAAFFSRGRSPDTWGSWVTVKNNAVELLKKRRSKLVNKSIYMSSVTDPYQPIERKLELTRRLLEVIADTGNSKLVVQTRSSDVTRDIDLFQKIVDNGGQVQVNITVTTDDEEIRRTFEPWCPGNEQRIGAAKELRNAEISTCITMTPLLWVKDASAFAETLCGTGVKQYIIQPFHFNRGKFVAGTRAVALELMAAKLHSTPESFRSDYLCHYREVRSVLEDRLPDMGEGKVGFAPNSSVVA